METCYRISPSQVAHQHIDGEVIVIHFETGSYFSLNGSAAELWQMLVKPQSVGSLCRRFSGANGQAESAVQKFVDELVGEKLVERIMTNSVRPNGEVPIPFAAPMLEKYSDMQHLLLADPLHDVEEAGWPKLKP
jgi:hypothetical protein